MKRGMVYVMHGIGHRPDSDSFLDRNLLDRAWFLGDLDRQPNRFVKLDEALAGKGDALTIDDGVYACFDAAMVARECGHEVTLFVNPGNIENQTPYWFSLLNLGLDRTTRSEISWNGSRYLLRGTEAKQSFRNLVKVEICRMNQETEGMDYLDGVLTELGVVTRELPHALQPLSRDDLKSLATAGVQIENHGWSHCRASDMGAARMAEDIRLGRAWLEQALGIQSRMFAAPFGDSPPPAELPADLCDIWFMADYRLQPGPISPGVFNRKYLGVNPSILSRIKAAIVRQFR